MGEAKLLPKSMHCLTLLIRRKNPEVKETYLLLKTGDMEVYGSLKP